MWLSKPSSLVKINNDYWHLRVFQVLIYSRMTLGPQFEYMDNGRNAFSPRDNNGKFLTKKNDGCNSGAGRIVCMVKGLESSGFTGCLQHLWARDTWGNHSASLCLSLLIYKSWITAPSSQEIVTNTIPWEECQHNAWHVVGTQVSTEWTNKWMSAKVAPGE